MLIKGANISEHWALYAASANQAFCQVFLRNEYKTDRHLANHKSQMGA